MTAVEDRLAEIEALAGAATEGPWKHNGVNGVHTLIGACVAATQIHEDQRRWEDAAFIAAARTLVPELVAALRAVLALIEETRLPAPDGDGSILGGRVSATRLYAAIAAAFEVTP